MEGKAWSELSEDSLRNLKGKAWSRCQAVLVQIGATQAARETREFEPAALSEFLQMLQQLEL